MQNYLQLHDVRTFSNTPIKVKRKVLSSGDLLSNLMAVSMAYLIPAGEMKVLLYSKNHTE